MSPTLAGLKAATGSGRRRRKQTGGGDLVIAYLRVSTDEQATSGLGLEAQEAAIRTECERRALTLVAVYADEGVSGTVSPHLRPGLAAAITAMDGGEAKLLMVSKVDRLARSFRDLAVLTPLAEKAGWNLVALNCAFDMTTPNGKAMAQMMGVFAELEADMIRQRTKDALAVKKAQGVKLGHCSQVTDEARAMLAQLRGQGLTWQAIADSMNTAGIPTSNGKVAWYPATAQRLCPPTPRGKAAA